MSLRVAIIYSSPVYEFEGPTIIYCPSRKATQQIVFELMKLGVACRAYHAGMGIKQRRETHHQFMRDEIQVCRKLSPLGPIYNCRVSGRGENLEIPACVSHLLCLQFWAKKLLVYDSNRVPGLCFKFLRKSLKNT